MPGLALLLLMFACAADALSTIALIERGGRERLLAWAIGEYPSPKWVWFAVCIFPVSLIALVLHWFPEQYPLVMLGAGWRAYLAHRNSKLRR